MSVCAFTLPEIRFYAKLLLLGLAAACELEPDYPSLVDPIALCGNASLDPGEECDDGNRENGDGCSAECLGQGSSAWTVVIDGPAGGTDCGTAIAMTPDGDVVVVGYTTVGDMGEDMWITRMTSAGETKWTKTRDGGAMYFDIYDEVAVSSDGIIYIGGTQYSSATQVLDADRDAWVEALAPDGTRLWGVKLDGGGTYNYAESIAADSTGVVVVGGQTVQGAIKAWAARLDSTGAIEWEATDDSDLLQVQSALGVKLSADRDVYIVGSTMNSSFEANKDRHLWLTRRGSTGDKAWTRLIEVSADGASNIARSSGHASLALDAAGRIWIAYEILSDSDAFSTDIKLIRMSSDATTIDFEYVYRGPGGKDDTLGTFSIGQSGALLLIGDTEVNGSGKEAWLQVHDTNGERLWSRTFGYTFDDFGTGITADQDYAYLTGCVRSNSLPTDVVVAKYVL